MNQVKKTFELITLITLISTLTATINIKNFNINNLGSVFKSLLGYRTGEGIRLISHIYILK